MEEEKKRAKIYRIEFMCSNCTTQFSKSLAWGEEALGRGGTCEYCGCADEKERPFGYRRSAATPFMTRRYPK